MLFPTTTFYLFFTFIFLAVWLLFRSNEWRKIFLLLASWVFYGAWDWRFVSLLIASGILNYLASEAIYKFNHGQNYRKLFLIVGIVANLLILCFFKYFGFFSEQLASVLNSVGWARDMPLIEVILPIGISFFTFQGMSYLIDVYRGNTKKASLLDLMLLMSFFPHLVAGPIVRASHLIPQFSQTPKVTRGEASAAIVLILWGLFKKVVIASELASGLVDPVFADPSSQSRVALLFGAYAYSVQIYCDFSAYSDMAVGLAGLLGYRFPRNFNQPYRASSLQDFWRRWHISLSSWLRDYLYISLGGSRHGLHRLCIALFLTMFLGGLWHGASWNFIIWGVLHGSILAMERIWSEVRKNSFPSMKQVPPWIGIVLTFHFVTFAWIFFRLENFSDTISYLKGFIYPAEQVTSISIWIFVLIIIGMFFHFTPDNLMQRIASRLSNLKAWQVALVASIWLLVIEALRPEGVAAFIYYQF